MIKSNSLMALALLIAFAAVVSACGGSAEPVNPPSGGGPVVAPTSAPSGGGQGGAITINGAGATFPYPLYSRWFSEYGKTDLSVRFNYQSIGSGGGIAQITARTVDFGASDAILNDAQLKAAPGIQMFPTVAGAVVPTYNLKDAGGKAITTAIKFPKTALADIFLGKIVKWNDPLIAQANPDIKLPAKDIIVVHRSDGSGTTFIFSDYLSKVSADWKSKVGNATSVKWPVGLGGKGNEGVSGTVAQNEGAIGYVELAYAKQNNLPVGMVQNKAGEFVSPTPQAVQQAMADFGSDLGDKLAVSIVDAPGKGSWPIAGYTYLLIYMNQTDQTKAQKLTAFLKWALSDGTKFATELDYIPLPDAVKTQVLKKLGEITVNGKTL
ncbi:MAG: phosphate ABC transporter substrate-binding protein PstS [Chloroflexi bacterium]|nr:phosphate ABC transporter substrate-binding protein PstS [Chloroflexota bacterium]